MTSSGCPTFHFTHNAKSNTFANPDIIGPPGGLPSNVQNTINVNVHNTGLLDGTCSVELYWAYPGTAITTNTAYPIISVGVPFPQVWVAAGNSRYVPFIWQPDPSLAQFSHIILFARASVPPQTDSHGNTCLGCPALDFDPKNLCNAQNMQETVL
jgi:hypothetical protein